jgi:hypothetical protein
MIGMKKLTRYTDFTSLKLDAKPSHSGLIRAKKSLHEFEEFLKLLRKRLLTSKKINPQKFGNEQ